jgi:hypothetical protein
MRSKSVNFTSTGMVQQLETQLLHMVRSYLIQVSVRSNSAPTTNSFVMTLTPVENADPPRFGRAQGKRYAVWGAAS